MRLTLTNGGYTLIDRKDYQRCVRHRWYCNNHGYAWCTALRQSIHRFILLAPKGVEVDHVNHDPLDNRRNNLRLCSHRQNHGNRVKNRGTGSRFKGVRKTRNRFKTNYEAYIGNKQKYIYLGRFDDEKDAAIAYDEAAKKLFGRFAHLNLGGKVMRIPIIRTLGNAKCVICKKQFKKTDSHQRYCSIQCRRLRRRKEFQHTQLGR